MIGAGLKAVYSQTPSPSAKGSIVAQGRLQPTKGILRLSALPGDRVEKVSAQAGSVVNQGDPLIVFESAKLKQLELEIAKLKLTDATLLYQSSLREARLAVDTAELKLRSTEQMQKQAESNLELVGRQTQILQGLEDQIKTLESIRSNPRLRGAVGSMEIEALRSQKIHAQSEYDRSLLGATQATQTAADLVAQAMSVVQSAKQAEEELKANPGYRSLEKQIELLEMQLEQATLLAPSNGTILQVNALPGERTAASPLIEMADLTQLSCVAEVHEADVGLVRIGQVAQMQSASLSRTIRGKVSRIDRVVGAPQIRSPNPLARSDFRSIAVWIQIDPEDVPLASERVQLQVEVSISP
ncbi:MAG: efflux RND transporter periplasmic adaptor subunit [Pirellula sp.]